MPQALSFAGTVTNNGASYNTTDSNYAIGYDPSDSGRNWSGYVSDVRVYKKALSQCEVTELFTGQDGNCGTAQPTGGLVGWWNMEEGGGATTADSANGNDGAIQSLGSGASWTTDTYGNGSAAALSFNGNSGCVLANSVATDQTSGWTISAMVDPASLPQQSNIVINGTDNDSYGNGFSFGIGDGGGGTGSLLQGVANGASRFNTGYTFPATGYWYYVVMTQTGSETDFYVNGDLVASPSFNSYKKPTEDYGNYGVAIGCQYGSSAFRDFKGGIDDVRVYSQPFSQADVTAMYNAYLADNWVPYVAPIVPQGPTPLSGWAWSSNIGWLSFNSSDSGAGGGAAYNVTVSTSTAGCSMTEACFGGYAWSPNIGWVSFEPSDIAAAPSCGSAATADLTTGAVTGFARAYSGIGATNGWDGCIALSGIGLPLSPDNFRSPDASGWEGTSTLGISLGIDSTNANTYGVFSGYSWESTAIGWLNFYPGFGLGVPPGPLPLPSHLPVPPVCVGNCGGPAMQRIIATCNADNTNPPSGASVKFTAVISNLDSGEQYTYSWNGSPGQSSYSKSYTSNQTGPALLVSDSGGDLPFFGACPSITINNNPTTNLHLMITKGSVTPPSNDFYVKDDNSLQIPKGQKFNLGWNVNLTSDYAGLCTSGVDHGSWPSWSNPDNLSSLNNLQDGSIMGITASTPGQYKFTIQCLSATTNPLQSSSVNLKVTSSSEGEI